MNTQPVISMLSKFREEPHLLEMNKQNKSLFVAKWLLIHHQKCREVFNLFSSGEIQLLPNFFWEELDFACKAYDAHQLNDQNDLSPLYNWRNAS